MVFTIMITNSKFLTVLFLTIDCILLLIRLLVLKSDNSVVKDKMQIKKIKKGVMLFSLYL